MFTIGKELRFEAAHSLDHLDDGHKCKRIHGHSYRIMVYVSGNLDEKYGWVQDYAEISDILKKNVYEILDHRNLNDFINPSTAENLAVWIWNSISDKLPLLTKVEVYETPTTIVTYEGK